MRQTWAFPTPSGQRLIADRQRLLSAALEAQRLYLKDQKETFFLVPVLFFVCFPEPWQGKWHKL